MYPSPVTRGVPLNPTADPLIMPTILSLQRGVKRIALLVFILSCFVGRSYGFEVSPPAFRSKRRNLPAFVKPFPSSHQSNDGTCASSLVLANIRGSSLRPLNLFRQPFDYDVYHLPLFRLDAAPSDDDDKSTSSSKIRSFVSKLFKALTSRAKKVLRWIRNKFQKTDKFLEETIEEQENKVAQAIADIEARANEIQSKNAALTSDRDMLDKTKDETVDVETETVVEKPDETPKTGSSPVEQETSATPQVETDEHESTAMDDLLAEEQEATAEAQTDIVEKVEEVQTMDAALATERAQLDKSADTAADIMTEMKSPPQKAQLVIPKSEPTGDRWAIAAPGVDLTGDWKLVVSDEFKKDYDEYLKQLGQPFLVRSVALTLIGVTTEQTEQKEDGRTLFIRGTNARGIWERTLITSGADKLNDQYTALHVPVDTADDERVEAEAWWEDDGKVHISWMRGISKYGGGDFESRRYLDDGGKVLVCESVFHPNETDRQDAGITWRFVKTGETS